MITGDIIKKAMEVRSQIETALADGVCVPVRELERAGDVIGELLTALEKTRPASRCAGAGCCGCRR